MARVLLTGFEPFDGASLNPAQEIVRALHDWSPDGHRVTGLDLPCVFGAARARLHEAITVQKPDIVIAIGQAANRAAISLERVALNFIDAPIPDNAGCRPVDSAVISGAPAAYFSTLPLRLILARLRAARMPAEISQTAGTYVCNELFYGLMHQAAGLAGKVRAAGFIHVPALPGQFDEDRPGMPLGNQIQAIRLAVLATLNPSGGAILDLDREGWVS